MDFQPRERSVKSAAMPVRTLLRTGIDTGGYVRWDTFRSILPDTIIISGFSLIPGEKSGTRRERDTWL